jgi:three-Cys-motif partner protein
MTSQFFDEQEEQSRVKTEILVAYFGAWATIMAAQSSRIAYIDLYAGPGRFADGSESTPLLIIKRILASPLLSRATATIFNDSDRQFCSRLQTEIDAIPGVSALRYKPEVGSEAVGERVSSLFAGTRMVPTLTFIDPWGYKGLSRNLIGSVIKDFGCEAVFFFNYNRINPAIANGNVEAHMEALFSSGRLEMLRRTLWAAPKADREPLLLRALGDSLQELGGRYLIPFRFLRKGGRVSHYICFVTKSRLGYAIMKDVMAKRGNVDEDDVPIFEYYPPADGRQLSFQSERPLTQLSADLLAAFSGRAASVKEIFDQHNVGRPFLLKNYQKVLKELELAGSIRCTPQINKRKPETLAKGTIVHFP